MNDRAALRLPRVLRDLGEDLRGAAQHLVLVGIGGSPYLPRAGRKWVYRLAGARMGSAPGVGFWFSGDPANLEIGPNVYLNAKVFVDAMGPVSIGADSGIGMQSIIVTSNHELRHGFVPTVTPQPVRIGERVGIAARVTILPGAVIEDDVVVAAGAVVSGRLKRGGLYAGHPARRIRDVIAVERLPST